MMGDFAVLAIDTAQRAAGKENGAGAACTGNRRFLPQVRSGPGNEHLRPEAAETRLRGAIRAALPRTKKTGRLKIHNSQFTIHNYLML
jgi:hypothetical protein